MLLYYGLTVCCEDSRYLFGSYKYEIINGLLHVLPLGFHVNRLEPKTENVCKLD